MKAIFGRRPSASTPMASISAVEGSPVVDVLKALEAKGVRLILCRTCLDYYGLAAMRWGS